MLICSLLFVCFDKEIRNSLKKEYRIFATVKGANAVLRSSFYNEKKSFISIGYMDVFRKSERNWSSLLRELAGVPGVTFR